MGMADRFRALRNDLGPVDRMRSLVKGVWGEGFTYREMEPEEKWEKAIDSDFDQPYNWSEVAVEAAKEMRKENRRERTAKTRAFNKALRAAGLDPTHFHRMAINHHALSPEQFKVLIERYLAESDAEWTNHLGHKTSNRNEFSKQQHTDL